MKTKKQKVERVEKNAAKLDTKAEPSKNLAAKAEKPAATSWTFFSNHSHVLFCLAREPDLRLRDVAERVAITERGVQRIIADLEEAGILSRVREGRRNHYQVHAQKPLRHVVEAHCTVGDLLKIVEAG